MDVLLRAASCVVPRLIPSRVVPEQPFLNATTTTCSKYIHHAAIAATTTTNAVGFQTLNRKPRPLTSPFHTTNIVPSRASPPPPPTPPPLQNKKMPLTAGAKPTRFGVGLKSCGSFSRNQALNVGIGRPCSMRIYRGCKDYIEENTCTTTL